MKRQQVLLGIMSLFYIVINRAEENKRPSDTYLKNFFKQVSVVYGTYYAKSTVVNLRDTSSSHTTYTLCASSRLSTCTTIGMVPVVLSLQKKVAQKDTMRVSKTAHILGALLAWLTPKPRFCIQLWRMAYAQQPHNSSPHQSPAHPPSAGTPLPASQTEATPLFASSPDIPQAAPRDAAPTSPLPPSATAQEPLSAPVTTAHAPTQQQQFDYIHSHARLNQELEQRRKAIRERMKDIQQQASRRLQYEDRFRQAAALHKKSHSLPPRSAPKSSLSCCARKTEEAPQ